jgi:LPXTG-motif cell wall-anchored protein
MVAATGAVTLLGSGAAAALAQTGSDDQGLGAIAALLALVGVVLMFGARNRTSTKGVNRIHRMK